MPRLDRCHHLSRGRENRCHRCGLQRHGRTLREKREHRCGAGTRRAVVDRHADSASDAETEVDSISASIVGPEFHAEIGVHSAEASPRPLIEHLTVLVGRPDGADEILEDCVRGFVVMRRLHCVVSESVFVSFYVATPASLSPQRHFRARALFCSGG